MGAESSPRAIHNTRRLKKFIVTPTKVNRKRFETTVLIRSFMSAGLLQTVIGVFEPIHSYYVAIGE
jgi:hypothetical protein